MVQLKEDGYKLQHIADMMYVDIQTVKNIVYRWKRREDEYEHGVERQRIAHSHFSRLRTDEQRTMWMEMKFGKSNIDNFKVLCSEYPSIPIHLLVSVFGWSYHHVRVIVRYFEGKEGWPEEIRLTTKTGKPLWKNK